MVRRRLVLALATLTGLAGCTSAPVHAAVSPLIEMHLIDRSRQRPLPEIRHRGTNWVVGRPGERYAVRLINRSGARVLVVLSIDGVNAISGETAATAQTGYVLAPWQSAEITGWRKSDAEAAAFYFTALPDSYAARTGRPDNVGVIGAAVFRERAPAPVVPFEPALSSRGRENGAARQDGAAGESRAAAPMHERDTTALRSDKLGTGHGEREYAPVARTTFERATSQPEQIVQIRYDSHANLVAAGVIAPPRRWAPDPFPGFVPDPPL